MGMNRVARAAVCVAWMASSGCTALREIPRGEYASRPQREHVRVLTRDGLVYEFDYANFGADSIVGYRRRDVETRIEEYATLGLGLADVKSLWVRSVNWTRTALIGGGAALVAIGAALRNNNVFGGGGGNSGPNPPVRPPPG